MIGNTRLYEAVIALVNGPGNAKSRVVSAMQILNALGEKEFAAHPEIWQRICKLRKQTQVSPPLIQVSNGHIIRDSYTTTAINKHNSTYSKFAKEIFDLWRLTCAETDNR